MVFLRRFAAALVVLGAMGCGGSAFGADCSKGSIRQLIDQLTQIDSQSPGVNSAALYDGFIADGTVGSFRGGVLGVAAPGVPMQMRDLVRCGVEALPELIEHLDDRTPTKLVVGNTAAPNAERQVGLDAFMFMYFSDEYAPRVRVYLSDRARRNMPREMEKDFEGSYVVKVGDVCFVLIGQIVNRRLLAVRYQPSGGLVVNSPIEAPVLVKRVRDDWGQGDAERLKASLLSDIEADSRQHGNENVSYITETTNAALRRLRLYFPGTYSSLTGEDLRKKKAFERHERQSAQ